MVAVRDIIDECGSDAGKPENGKRKGFRVTADRTDAWARALITPVVSRPPTTNEENR